MTLYLKYRPQDFQSLVWQEFIKTTLKKAVADNKLVWAYMFTWPRWTGKTSTARIFAKAINCSDIQNGEPCGKCEICNAFHNNGLIDIIEIDAASHTGVDNIREIIERAQFQPSQAQYKVYIIDEVHMLSKGAFNALLKILEEPPKHVKFILATTDIHKVPDTILSRCQRYDFHNFTDNEIRGRLEYIAKQEKIQVDDESYDFISQSSEWAMRNAVSLFEQLIVDNVISFSHIEKTLWVTQKAEERQFLEKILLKDSSLLSDLDMLVQAGKNIKNFLKAVAYTLQEKCEQEICQSWDISEKILILESLEETLRKTKNSFDENLTIKIGLLKILGWNTKNNTQIPPLSQTLFKEKEGASDKKTLSSLRGIDWKKEENRESLPEKTGDMFSQVHDIFAESSSEDTEPSPQTQKKTATKNTFDITAFIWAVKSAWGKAALVMSLKGSKIELWGDTLTITGNTKISRNTLEKPEHKEMLLEIWETFWTPFSSLNIV